MIGQVQDNEAHGQVEGWEDAEIEGEGEEEEIEDEEEEEIEDEGEEEGEEEEEEGEELVEEDEDEDAATDPPSKETGATVESKQSPTSATHASQAKAQADTHTPQPSSAPVERPPVDAPASKPSATVDLQQLEDQAAQAARAAVDMGAKLADSFKNALGGFGASASTASDSQQPTLSKLAGGLSSWWSSLDPPSQPKRDETLEAIQASSKATSELQELFGLVPEENLVETFKCRLLQTYGCNHNNFTPAIQMAFQGTLYITDKHTCFSVEERNRKLPFKVLHTDIRKATRQRPTRKGDLSDLLRLDLVPEDGRPQFLTFKDFDSGSALDSALALVEHLMDDS